MPTNYEYIKPVTNNVYIKLVNNIGIVEDTVLIIAFPEESSEDLNTYSKNNLMERVLLKEIGDMFYLTFDAYNHDVNGANDQANIIKLDHFVSLAKAGTHYLEIWPWYSDEYTEASQDHHSYVNSKNNSSKPINDRLNVGNLLTYSFESIKPEIGYVTKVPVETTPIVLPNIIMP